MFNKFFNHKKKSGFALIIVLILMVILLAITYLYSDAIFSELAIARNNKASSIAFSMAEAGIQEAVYRIQHNDEARTHFKGEGGILFPNTVSFTQSPAWADRGSYEVTIQNVSQGVANVDSYGFYRIGFKTARREIKVGLAQAAQPPPFDKGGLYGGGGSGESIADIDITDATVNVYAGGLWTNRDFWLRGSANVASEGKEVPGTDGVQVQRPPVEFFTWHHHDPVLNCNCLINGDGDPDTPQCSENPGCTATAILRDSMPTIDFNSYKTQAQTHLPNQYFPSQTEFEAAAPAGATTTFEGTVYVDGPLTLDGNRTIVINGVIAASGSITVDQATLTVARTLDSPAGVLTQRGFNLDSHGHFEGTGLLYAGDAVTIASAASDTVTINGGILGRRIAVSGSRTIDIYYNPDVINATLTNSPVTPVIEVNHWEEEY